MYFLFLISLYVGELYNKDISSDYFFSQSVQ